MLLSRYFQSLRNHPLCLLLRLNRLGPIFLIVSPAFWGVVAANRWGERTSVDWFLIGILWVGAFAMRSAGCIYNDIIDRDIDLQVKRTQSRPLASGRLSLRHGVVVFILCLALGGLACWQLNTSARLWACAVLPLVGLYPWMKRVTFWPQVILGFCLGWGVLVGWVATGREIEPSVFWLYGIGGLWTVAYDTIYAYQDYDDDVRIGVKSSAVKLGQGPWLPKIFLGICWLAIVGILIFLGSLHECGIIFYLGVLFIFSHFVWQGWTLNVSDSKNCSDRFLSNNWVGFFVWVSLLLG